jgi:N-acetylneuraminic acid mutarotase
MTPPTPLILAVAAGAFALISCSPDENPTQPTTGDDELSSAPSFAVAANSWSTNAPMPTARGYLAAGVANSSAGQIFYAIGGVSAEPSSSRHSLTTVEGFNLATNRWTTKTPLPVALHRTNGVGVIGGRLYVSGGETLIAGGEVERSKALFVFDPGRNSWARRADMPSTSASGISGVIDGKLYVLTDVCALSGCSNTSFPTRLWRYDPATNTWNTSLRPCPANHRAGAGGVIAGKFYVVGGTASNSKTQRVHVYDPATDTWAEKAALPNGRSYPAGAVTGNKLYVLGGVESSAGVTRTVSMYNPVTNTWTNKAPMPTARSGLAAARVTLADGQRRIVAAGGHGVATNEVYTP